MPGLALNRISSEKESSSVSPEIALVWDRISVVTTRFPPSAYVFVQEGLRHTVQRLLEDEESGLTLENRHISGAQLCLGLRDYALHQYGHLARTVLAGLGIRRTEDFGRIVFTLVEVGLMRKTDDDRAEDFQCVFDFDEAFVSPLTVG